MTSKPLIPPCASGCAAAQMALFADPTPRPAAAPAALTAEFDWDFHDVVIVGDSGGKDSGATVHEVCTQADKAGQLHKVRVLHCDLGRTEARAAVRRAVRGPPQRPVALAVGPHPGARQLAWCFCQVLHE